MIAQVYFNLHKKSWSIRDSVTHRVINKLDPPTYLVVLTDVQFKVNETGRRRVIREKRKNVHAFACGTMADVQAIFPRLGEATVPVSYNPYKGSTFVRTDTGEPVASCRLLLMCTKLVEVTHGNKRAPKRIPCVLAAL